MQKNSLRRGLWVWVCLSILMPVLGMVVQPAVAEQPTHSTAQVITNTPTCWALDIVIMVDQSTSMFREGDGNDPLGYRFKAVKEVLDRLIRNRREECVYAVNRLGLVVFGSDARVVLPLIEVNLASDESIAEWVKQYHQEIDSYADDRSEYYQNGTDPYQAFEEVESLFAEASPMTEPPGYKERRKVMIMITDGNPDGVGMVPNYMCRLMDYVNSAAFADSSLWILPLYARTNYGNADGCGDRTTVNSNWRSMTGWSQRARQGRVVDLEYNEQAIPFFISTIVNSEFGLDGVTRRCDEPFYINPYLQHVRLTFYRREADNLFVTLSKLEGSPEEPVFQVRQGEVLVAQPADWQMTIDYEPTSIREDYVLHIPRPGKWKFNVEGLSPEECTKRINATEVDKAAAVLIEPNNTYVLPMVETEPYYDAAQDVNFIVRLQTNDGRLIQPLREYPVDMTLSWTLPGGGTTLPNGAPIAPVRLTDAKDGTWTSGNIQPLSPVEGVYNLTITATATFGDGAPGYSVFTSPITTSYVVNKIELMKFAVLAPTQKANLPCNNILKQQSEGVPVEIKVGLQSQGGAALPPRLYLLDTNQVFQVSAISPAGVVVAGPVWLTPSASETGVYEGKLFENMAQVEGCGELNLVVNFVGKYDNERFNLPEIQQTVAISRNQTRGVLAAIASEPPDENAIHLAFCAAEVQPVRLEIKASDLSGGRLTFQEMAAGDPASLYSARLHSPDDQVYEDLTPVLEERSDGYVLVFTGGLTATIPGEYSFEVWANPQAFKPGFLPADPEPLQVDFQRSDTFLTQPSTCRNAQFSAGGLLLFLVALLIFAFTGGPGGILEITEYGNPDRVVSALRLSRARVFKTLRRKELLGLGIDAIQYKKSGNGITISATDALDKSPIVAELPLTPDDAFPLNSDYDIIYRK